MDYLIPGDDIATLHSTLIAACFRSQHCELLALLSATHLCNCTFASLLLLSFHSQVFGNKYKLISMLQCPVAENGFFSQASQLGSSMKRSLTQWCAWLITSHTPLPVPANLPIHSPAMGRVYPLPPFPTEHQCGKAMHLWSLLLQKLLTLPCSLTVTERKSGCKKADSVHWNRKNSTGYVDLTETLQ